MGTKLLLPFLLVINFCFGAVATAIIGVSIIVIGIPKLLLPIPVVQRSISTAANALFRVWGYAMSLMFRLTQPMRWEVKDEKIKTALAKLGKRRRSH